MFHLEKQSNDVTVLVANPPSVFKRAASLSMQAATKGILLSSFNPFVCSILIST